MRIAVTGVGYVGLSLAVLLAQNHKVTAITTTESKACKLNVFVSPIQDDEIESSLRRQKQVSDILICTRLQTRLLLIRMPSL